MKILARTDHSYFPEYVVSMTQAELAALTGRTESAFNSGAVIAVLPMYQHFHALASAKKDIATAAAMLRSAATLMESAPSPLTPPPVEVPPPSEG